MSDQAVLHVKGRVLVGADDVRDELWVVGGRISYERPGARDIRTVEGWALPGLVDAHCHVGLDAHGPVPDDVSEKQALTDREAADPAHPGRGLALRHPLDRRPRRPPEDHPRGPATSPAPAATSATTRTRSSRRTWSRTSPRRPGAATAG